MIFLIVALNVLSVAAYFGVVRPRQRGEMQLALIVGLGVVIPVSLWFPFFLMENLDIRSVPYRMGLISMPITACFRTLEGEK